MADGLLWSRCGFTAGLAPVLSDDPAISLGYAGEIEQRCISGGDRASVGIYRRTSGPINAVRRITGRQW